MALDMTYSVVGTLWEGALSLVAQIVKKAAVVPVEGT